MPATVIADIAAGLSPFRAVNGQLARELVKAGETCQNL